MRNIETVWEKWRQSRSIPWLYSSEDAFRAGFEAGQNQNELKGEAEMEQMATQIAALREVLKGLASTEDDIEGS